MNLDKKPEVEKETYQMPLTFKELKALKKARYKENADKYPNNYVLQNKKTNQMVEIRAYSPLHACNIIGWKTSKVKLVMSQTKEEADFIKRQETTSNEK